jgi:hypothetical protein
MPSASRINTFAFEYPGLNLVAAFEDQKIEDCDIRPGRVDDDGKFGIRHPQGLLLTAIGVRLSIPPSG